MEQLQIGYITAVAASAGCILSPPIIDDGIDIVATHGSESHTGTPDGKARLEIQLKATSQFVGASGKVVSAPMRRDRWQYYRAQGSTVRKIVVVMSMPALQSEWVSASHDFFAIRHCAYWVNVATLPATDAMTPTVSAPKLNVFDDLALCEIMERVGQGGAP